MRSYKSKPVGRAPKPKSAHVTKSMQSNKSYGTKPEVILSKLLRKKLYKNNLPGNPDFTFPKNRLAVFVHGCFWHRCPRCKPKLPKSHRAYWKRKFDRNIERDKMNRRELKKLDWKVIEIWEHELNNGPKNVLKKIQANLARTS